jgi:hypothetical protein
MLKPIVQNVFIFLKVCRKTHIKHRLLISDGATNMTIVLDTVNGFEFFEHNAQETGSVSTISIREEKSFFRLMHLYIM